MALPAGFSRRWPKGGGILRYPGRLAAGPPSVYTPQDGDPLYLDNIQTATASTGTESSGFLSDTNYRIAVGGFRLQAAGYIECMTAGRTWRHNQYAYSTQTIEFYKKAASTTRFLFVASGKGAADAAGQDCYQIQLNTDGAIFFYRYDSGAFAALPFRSAAGTVAPDARYCLATTRSGAGVFSVYILGGAFAVWTLLAAAQGANPLTDNTHTASLYTVHDMDAGDRLYHDRQFAGVVPPL